MTPRNRNIGIIGKTVLTDYEKETIRYIGRCIARMGHRLMYVPAKGTADVLSEGVKVEGGETLPLDAGVVDRADHTLIYPDKRLLTRLLAAYPNLTTRTDVAIIEESQLDEWLEAVKSICRERSIALPG